MPMLKTSRDGAARMTYSVQNNNELLTVKENGLYNPLFKITGLFVYRYFSLGRSSY